MPPRSKSKNRKRTSPPPVVLIEEQEQHIKNAFQLFDTKKTGSIRVKQARNAIQSLGLDSTKEEVRVACSSHEKVDYATFLQLVGPKIVQREKALQAFRLIDKDGKGVVCFEDLQRVAQELGESMTDDELLEMLEDADKSGQGFLSQDDFLNMARGLNL